jgi:predicted nucleic acid-binding Zn ribbon protein
MFFGTKQKKTMRIISMAVGVIVILGMILAYLPSFWG